jgi:hypothetical protein
MKFTESEKKQVILLLKNYLNNKKIDLNSRKIKNLWFNDNKDEYILEEICLLCKKLVKS